MAFSRGQKKRTATEFRHGDNVAHPCESDLPVTARHINSIIIDKQESEVTNHVEMARKAAKGKRTHTLFFKRHDDDSPILEMEAYCAAICQLLATSDYVSSSTSYYNDMKKLVGVGSMAIQGFKCNKDDPLLAEDVYIDSVSIKMSHQKNILLNHINHILMFYAKRNAISLGVQAIVSKIRFALRKVKICLILRLMVNGTKLKVMTFCVIV